MSKIGFSSLARLGLAALGIGTALFLLFRVNDRHPATGKFSAMKCVAGLIGRFDGIEFCVAASLSGQNVDVEEITETAKGVFENRPGQRAWRGFHKQTLLVRSCRAFLWDHALSVRQLDADRVIRNIPGFGGCGSDWGYGSIRIRNKLGDHAV